MHCTDLHAVVPAHVAWRDVSLAVQNVMDLRFEAVLSFADILPIFRFSYLTLQVCHRLSQPALFFAARFLGC